MNHKEANRPTTDYSTHRKSAAAALGLLTPLLFAALVFVLFNFVLPSVTNYFYWVKPASAMGWTVQMQDIVRHQYVAGKKNVIVLGDSRVSEGFSAILANQVSERPDVNFIKAGMPGTTPRTWFYFLKKIDPHHDMFDGIVLMAARYDDDNDANDPKNYELDLTYLQPLINFRDIPKIAKSFGDVHEQLHAFGILASPLFAARDDLQDFYNSPKARIVEARGWHQGFFASYDAYEPPSVSVPALNANELATHDFIDEHWAPAVLNEMQTYVGFLLGKYHGYAPASTAKYRTEWYGGIADEYREKGVQVFVFQIPGGPYESFSKRKVGAVSALQTLANSKRITLLSPDPIKPIEVAQNFADALHVNRDGEKLLTRTLASLVVKQIPEAK